MESLRLPGLRLVQRGVALFVPPLVVAGCVFVPRLDVPEPTAATVAEADSAPAMPDPDAPRLPALETRHFELADSDQDLIGEVQVVFTRYENTFTAIAREYNLGYEALRVANPTVDHWLPGEQTPVFLPTQQVLPEAPRDGIVINLPSMRLYYFTKSDGAAGEKRVSVTSHPIGIGREGWATPTGTMRTTDKARDPTWYPPASVRADHAARGDPLPAVVPPGPDNPLGRFAIALSMPGYLIHGTNRPAGVGMRVSAGCIRLYPEDIERLFDRIARGTPVHIVDQPVLAGWRDGELYLVVHRPLDEDDRDLHAEAAEVLARALDRAGADAGLLDQETVTRVVTEQRGIPFPVLSNSAAPERYLARSRIVENTVTMPRSAAVLPD
jgi:L,D-transpeptidase ErfK/SrfK